VSDLAAVVRWWSALIRRRSSIALAIAAVAVLVWILTADDLNGILGPGS